MTSNLDKSPLDHAIEAARAFHEALAAMKVTGANSESVMEAHMAYCELESRYKQAEKLFPGYDHRSGFVRAKAPKKGEAP